METAKLIDYAMPLMVIERLAKEVYDACLEQDLGKASEIALKLGTEARILQLTLAIMQNKETTR
jgi:hypothetical protein